MPARAAAREVRGKGHSASLHRWRGLPRRVRSYAGAGAAQSVSFKEGATRRSTRARLTTSRTRASPRARPPGPASLERHDRQADARPAAAELRRRLRINRSTTQSSRVQGSGSPSQRLCSPPRVSGAGQCPPISGSGRGSMAGELSRRRAGWSAIGRRDSAAEAAALGLIDEYRARVYPVPPWHLFFPSARCRGISNVETRDLPLESCPPATAWRAEAPVRRAPGIELPGICGNRRLSMQSGAFPEMQFSGQIRTKFAWPP